jgi:hypothetical protein
MKPAFWKPDRTALAAEVFCDGLPSVKWEKSMSCWMIAVRSRDS